MRNGKYVLIVGVLAILFALGLGMISYGLGIGPLGRHIDKDFEVSTESAVKTTEAAVVSKEAITVPVEKTTKAAVTEGTLTKGAVTNAGITGETGETPNKIQSNTKYSSLYPEMCVPAPTDNKVIQNTIFLTFDDGPGAGTEQVLNTLAAHEAKATFFLVGTRINEQTAPLIQRMVDEGHSIAVHTTCHDYRTIYASVEAYLKDFNTTYEKIYDYTGTYPRIYRFPGGSINSFNKSVYRDIISELSNRGFTYYDWNISAGDATKGATEKTIYANSMVGLKYKNASRNAILLMHDTSTLSSSQLDNIMTAYEQNGFSFTALDQDIKPIKM